MDERDDPYVRISDLGLRLPQAPAVVGNYRAATIAGSLVYISGQGPNDPLSGWKTGKVGVDYSVSEGYAHARLAGLTLLAALEAEIGSLSKVKRVLKVLGMVNASPEFTAHPNVIDGCSDLFVEIFGSERGRHARSAVGMASLPGNISVEIEAIFEIEA